MIETIIVTALESQLIVELTVGYFLSSAISIYDTRLIQWRKLGDIPADVIQPPQWTGLFGLSEWILLIIMLILDWKYALLLWLFVFILKVIPVMENIGKLIVTTFIDGEIGKGRSVSKYNSINNE